MALILILFLQLFFSLYSEEDGTPIEISFFEILETEPSKLYAQIHGKKISIRGFLYNAAENGWVVAPQPNLRSCCVGKEEKKRGQIYLVGKLPVELPSSAVEIVGSFEVSFGGGPLYKIKDPSISQERSSLKLWGLFLLFLLIAFFIISKKFRKK